MHGYVRVRDRSSSGENLAFNGCGNQHPADNTVFRKELGLDVMQEAVRISVDAHIPIGCTVRHLEVGHRIFIDRLEMRWRSAHGRDGK